MSVSEAIGVSVVSRGVKYEKVHQASAGKEIVIDELLPYNGGTPQAVAVAIARSKLQSLVMVADGALSVVANAGRTFALAAGVPVVWYEGIGVNVDTFLNSLDIASLSATNATGLSVRFRLWAVIDPT